MADRLDVGLAAISRLLGERPDISANAVIRELRASGVTLRRQEALSSIRELRGVERRSPVASEAARRGGYRSGAARYVAGVKKREGRITEEAVLELRRRRNRAERAGEGGKRQAYDYDLLRLRAEAQGITVPRNATSAEILQLIYDVEVLDEGDSEPPADDY